MSQPPDPRSTREVIETWLYRHTGWTEDVLPTLADDLLSELREHFTAHYASPEEDAVFDFLNWLAPQNIELHKLIPGGCSEATEGELFERWKAEGAGGVK